ncbi:MAG: hypothetical protein JWP25_1506 [Bradyrhizobium sp.]|jgi:hypothetical protein|nr:hypothetical protein [Bradyrhizobium sp.]MEA2868245.1 hypothetical protein [Bradyrhizobium sp.]
MSVDRHQIVEAVGLDAVAGIVEQRDVGADQFGAELLQDVVEAGLVEVKLGAAADDEKPSDNSVSDISLASAAGFGSAGTAR